MNLKIILAITGLVLIVGIVYFFLRPQAASFMAVPTLQPTNSITPAAITSPTYSAPLVDVTKRAILGVDTKRGATGSVEVFELPNDYELVATFENLPDPKNTDFYEGWLVSSNPVKAISTGVAVKVDGKYINRFESTEDMSIYTMYVLTLEPDDNDPASAYHILEGTFK